MPVNYLVASCAVWSVVGAAAAALRRYLGTGRPPGDWRIRGGPGDYSWPPPPPTQARSARRPQTQTEIDILSPGTPWGRAERCPHGANGRLPAG